MTSHRYELNRPELLRRLGRPLIGAAAFAILMHLAAWAGWLPAPRPTLDVDRTLLVHQVEACRTAQDAQVIVIGDSSCLMDVSASQLSQALDIEVLNLGTLSYLDARAFARLLRAYVATNPGKLRAVVLLQHPEALRRIGPEEYHVRLLEALLAGTDFSGKSDFYTRLAQWTGVERFRTRLWCRLVPTPLGGPFGRRYGFSTDFDRYLQAHQGSAIDPDAQPFQGNAEYRLAPQLESASRAFHQAVPSGVKLFVGITPVPEQFAGSPYPPIRDAMLRQWSQWLEADAALRELPPTLPDGFFVKTTHLDEKGVRVFTRQLADALKPHLR